MVAQGPNRTADAPDRSCRLDRIQVPACNRKQVERDTQLISPLEKGGLE